MKNTTKSLMGLAIAGLIGASGTFTAVAASADDAKGVCMGANQCKGKGACATKTSKVEKGNACAGKNACKGKGFTKVTKEECDAVPGAKFSMKN